MRRKADAPLASLSLMLMVALTGCSKQAVEPEPVVSVQVVAARQADIEQVVTVEAVLYPRNQAAITPKIVAPVRHFYVNRGSRVRKGQLLAVLENRDLAAAVTENKGTLEQAQATYETTTRASLPEELRKAELDAKSAHEALAAEQKLYDSRRMLFQEGALPRKELDQAAVALVQARARSELADQHLAAVVAVGQQQSAKAAGGQLASAQGKYAGAAAQLSYTEIRSPIDGVVTDRPNYQGEMPGQGVPLLTVMDTSSVIARAHVPQEQAAVLKAGDAAILAGTAGDRAAARIVLISPALDPGSTTVEVWIEAENKAGVFRPGSTVTARLVGQRIANAITVPSTALLKMPDGRTSVMVVGADRRAQRVEVETGVVSGDTAQILKGVKAGEIVIVGGSYGLPEGTLVKADAAPQPEKPPAGRR